ncbi:MAG: discoidin domain-containing protein [Bacteroidales bacterium]
MKSIVLIAVVLAVLGLQGARGRALQPPTAASPPGSYFDGGSLFIVSSSHQDTAWMDTPAACRQFRIDKNILPALEMMRKNPDYTFCMEGTLHLMELLEAHPELRDEVIRRMQEGRLEFGATYNQPYESWLSGEELVRQVYFGRRWIKKNLPGCDAKVAFNPDPPARSLQMQQILAKAGVPYMFISRYHEGLYRWLSPDGTGVLLYSPGHYGNHQPFLDGDPAKGVQAIAIKLRQQEAYYRERSIPPAYCLINSQDFSTPIDFAPLIRAWNEQSSGTAGSRPPTMRYASIRGFFEALDKPAAKFDTLMGERPDVWVYITGPTHHWTASVRREAARLLPAAETFTTFACLLDGSFRAWPSQKFDAAWMDEIYIDHGIGGKNGHITDEVFQRKVESARNSGRVLLDHALTKIAVRVKSDPARGTPITVFNTLSWQRSGPVEIDVPQQGGALPRVVDGDGEDVESELTTLGSPDERNVAASAVGARASASSVSTADYGADKAIDGRWAVRDRDAALGAPDEWRSAPGAGGPHWLTVDLGRRRTIQKVVVRHEGVVGAFGGETKYNTSDFRIQAADAATGPWTDLVAPVSGNTMSLTVHRFSPTATRFLRVFITRSGPADMQARIFEVQAFEKVTPKPRLLFVARDVPPLGYRTYYVKSGSAGVRKSGSQRAEPRVAHRASASECENDFYRVVLAAGGIKSIFDKRLNREMLNTSKFLGGEVFSMLSVAPDNRGAGTDAGEFGIMPLPVMDSSFDRVARHQPRWTMVENGPVRTVYQLEQPLAETTVRQRVVVWHGIKRVDCEVDLREFNGTLWREFRMALPLAAEKARLAYQVPMGVVEVGKDEIPTTGGFAYGTLTYSQQARDIRPREVQDFVDASDARGGLTMSSDVSVFDWQDVTSDPVAYPVLQPVLLASRKSCNGEGNWYPQAGDHTYRFALTTHDGDWRNGRQAGIGANHPFEAVVGARPAANASLPAVMSFASVSSPNVVVSTMKKAEDDDSVVARVYDIEGKDSQAIVGLFKTIAAAQKTDVIEEGGEALKVVNGKANVPVGHHAIETVKIHVK